MKPSISVFFSMAFLATIFTFGWPEAHTLETSSIEPKCLAASQKAAWDRAKQDAGEDKNNLPLLSSMSTEIQPRAIPNAPVYSVRVSFDLIGKTNKTYEIHSQVSTEASNCTIGRISQVL